MLDSRCDPVKVRSRLGANYNCFVGIDRDRSGGRAYTTGYRFSARAQLPAGTLAWCKENPRPLHPTSQSYVSLPISTTCRYAASGVSLMTLPSRSTSRSGL